MSQKREASKSVEEDDKEEEEVEGERVGGEREAKVDRLSAVKGKVAPKTPKERVEMASGVGSSPKVAVGLEKAKKVQARWRDGEMKLEEQEKGRREDSKIAVKRERNRRNRGWISLPNA